MRDDAGIFEQKKMIDDAGIFTEKSDIDMPGVSMTMTPGSLSVSMVEQPFGKPPSEQAGREFMESHPSMYAAMRTLADFIPYTKYIDPYERREFYKLAKDQRQKDLLLQDLEALGYAVAGPVMKQAGKAVSKVARFSLPFIKRHLPRTHAMLEKTYRALSKPRIVRKAETGEVRTISKKPLPKDVEITETSPLPKYDPTKTSMDDVLKRADDLKGEKKYVSWDETERLGDEILEDTKRVNIVLEKAKAGEGLNTAEIHVTSKTNINAIDKLKKLVEEYQSGRISKETLDQQFTLFRDDIFKLTVEGSAEVGRALNYHKKYVGPNRIAKGLASLKKSLTEKQWKEFLHINLNDETAVTNFLGKVSTSNWDVAFEVWYNSILSGPGTQAINTISNLIWGLFQIPHRALAGATSAVGSALFRGARERFISEVGPMTKGWLKGFVHGLNPAKQMLFKGRLDDKTLKEIDSKWARDVGEYILSALGKKGYKKLEAGISVPTRALRAMDLLFNAAAYDGELAAIAKRTGLKKGLKGVELNRFMQEFIEKIPAWAHKDAMKFARHATFMDDPGSIAKWVENRPRAIRIIIPFVRTINNLLKRGLEMTPGVGIAAGRKQPASEIMAKQLEGALLAFCTCYKADMGELTGPWPENVNEREQWKRTGKKPWSIKVGDKWISYRRVEPFAMALGTAAISYHKIKNKKDTDTWTQAFYDTFNAMRDYVVDTSYFTGLKMLVGRHSKAGREAGRIVGGLVPYSSLLRTIGRTIEASKHGGILSREDKTLLSQLTGGIPGLDMVKSKKLTIWGKEVMWSEGIFSQWLPYRWTKERKDLVETSLEKLDVYPGLPDQIVTIHKGKRKGEKIRLDNDIYRDMVILGGKKAYERLQKIFKGESAQSAIDSGNKARREALIGVINKAVEDSFDEFRKEAIDQQERRRLEQKAVGF